MGGPARGGAGNGTGLFLIRDPGEGGGERGLQGRDPLQEQGDVPAKLGQKGRGLVGDVEQHALPLEPAKVPGGDPGDIHFPF
jgi:hypothetical protein